MAASGSLKRAKQKSFHSGSAETVRVWALETSELPTPGLTTYRYPAMMSSEIHRFLIAEATEGHESDYCIMDPFMGSGTILREAMSQGLSFVGQDINPLSLLLSRIEAGPFHPKSAAEGGSALRKRIREDSGRDVDHKFRGIEKWFRHDVARDLCCIRRNIIAEERLWLRRLYWRALAETVRLTSNSRLTTFKMHIRDAQEVLSRRVNAYDVFQRALARHLSTYATRAEELARKSLLYRGKYLGQVLLSHGDSAEEIRFNMPVRMAVTSPPYGDNPTTVPYGQHSHLPLQWIPLKDIDDAIGPEWTRSGHFIDRMSLGGRNGANPPARNFEYSETLTQLLARFPKSSSQYRRVSSYFADLSRALYNLHDAVDDGGRIIITIGERRVAGVQVPLGNILKEFFEHRGSALRETWLREIPLKRMASRNGAAPTMLSEKTLVFDK